MVLQKVGIERMIFVAALFLVLVPAMTVPIVKAYEWLQDFLYGTSIDANEARPG